jgi:hypothetical protein
VQAAAGVHLSMDVTTATTPTAISAGTTLTIASGKSLSTTDQALTVTARDIVLVSTSSLTSGTAAMSIHGAVAGQTIALGATPGKQMQLEDAELALIAATGFTIGSVTSGSIYVNAVAATSSNALNSVALVATRDDATITFLTAPSIFNTLTAQADDGIAVQASKNT